MAITLTYPWALALLALLPWLLWRYLHSSRGAWQFSDRRLLPPPRRSWAYGGDLFLRMMGMILLIVALAGPRWPDPASRIPTEGISIAMVVDVSESMSHKDFDAPDGKISRLEGVKNLFALFVSGGTAAGQVELPGRPHDLIALVTFGTHAETTCPLTLDHAALLKIMQLQKPRTAPGEGTTNAGDAIVWALHVLQQAPTKRKVIVFLTDGESNVRDKPSPRKAAHLAANLRVPIYAIDASPEPEQFAKQDAIDKAREARETMQVIAKMTDGHYFRAQDSSGLLLAYKNIDQMERDRILSFQYRRYHEGFVWFALAGLACWLTLIVLESTWWRKVP